MDLLLRAPRVQIVACREVLVENHRGLIGYEPEQIDVNSEPPIRIRGLDLDVGAMNSRDLLVRGKILSVEFLV